MGKIEGMADDFEGGGSAGGALALGLLPSRSRGSSQCPPAWMYSNSWRGTSRGWVVAPVVSLLRAVENCGMLEAAASGCRLPSLDSRSLPLKE